MAYFDTRAKLLVVLLDVVWWASLCEIGCKSHILIMG